MSSHRPSSLSSSSSSSAVSPSRRPSFSQSLSQSQSQSQPQPRPPATLPPSRSSYFPHQSRSSSSSSHSSGSSSSSFAQLTSLRDDYHALQSELAATKAMLEKAKQSAAKSIPPSSQPAALPVSSGSSFSSSSTDLIARVYHLERELDGARKELETSKSSILAAEQLHAQLQAEKSALESKVFQLNGSVKNLQSENEKSKEENDQAKQEKVQLEQRISDLGRQLQSAEAEMRQVNQLSASSARESFERAESQAALLNSANSHGRQVQAMQNELQAARQFIAQLKSEFESAASEWRSQQASERADSQRQIERLRDSLSQQIERSHLDAIAMASEQQQILAALQEQFDQYRQTAESIFQSEAAGLKLKLDRQQAKFEEEIRLLHRHKDSELARLMLAKDAKILALIEGTEMQKILLRHQTEMELMAKSHAAQLDAVKQEARNEQRAVIEQLRKEVEAKQMEIERFHGAIQQWEAKLDHTVGLLRKQKRLHMLKEEQNEKAQKEMLNQLKEAHEKIEELIRVKESLRHKILRLRLQIEGAPDESIQATIKRLTKDGARMSAQLENMQFQYDNIRKEAEGKGKESARHMAENAQLREALVEARDEQSKIAKTFQRFLHGRLKGLTGAERQSLLPREPAEIINIIGEFAEKTLKRMETNKQSEENDESAASIEHSNRLLESAQSSALRRSVVLDNGRLIEREEKRALQEAEEDRAASRGSSKIRTKSMLHGSAPGVAIAIDEQAINELERGFQTIEKFKRENQRIRNLEKTLANGNRTPKQSKQMQMQELAPATMERENDIQVNQWPQQPLPSAAREMVKIYGEYEPMASQN